MELLNLTNEDPFSWIMNGDGLDSMNGLDNECINECIHEAPDRKK